jgi:hypothetical protein
MTGTSRWPESRKDWSRTKTGTCRSRARRTTGICRASLLAHATSPGSRMSFLAHRGRWPHSSPDEDGRAARRSACPKTRPSRARWRSGRAAPATAELACAVPAPIPTAPARAEPDWETTRVAPARAELTYVAPAPARVAPARAELTYVAPAPTPAELICATPARAEPEHAEHARAALDWETAVAALAGDAARRRRRRGVNLGANLTCDSI